jgi:uncharacterized iron-regulated membrane protein
MRQRKSARSIWLAIHVYVGLFLGGVFALLGLSGSVLVFYPEIDRTLNPATAIQSKAFTPPTVQAVFDQLSRQYPERQGPWRIEMPLTPSTPFMARYYNPPERAGQMFAPLMVTLDPQTLAVTSSRFWGDYAMTWVFDLHYTFLMGSAGQTAVGVVGFFMAASLLTGLYLWWPSAARLWRAMRPVLRRGPVLQTYDLHALAGLYGWLVLLVLALTGSALALPQTTQRMLAVWSDPQPSLQALSGLIPAGGVMLNLDDAVAVAQAKFPQAELRWIETPGLTGAPIALRFYQAGEPGRRFPSTRVWVHPLNGSVLMQSDATQNSSADTFKAWLHPLHNGEAFGLPGRVLACIAGILPTLLFVTGWLRWRQKKRARDYAAQQKLNLATEL